MENQICSHWAQFSDPILIFQFKKGNTALYGSVLMLLKNQEHQNISNISQSISTPYSNATGNPGLP